MSLAISESLAQCFSTGVPRNPGVTQNSKSFKFFCSPLLSSLRKTEEMGQNATITGDKLLKWGLNFKLLKQITI